MPGVADLHGLKTHPRAEKASVFMSGRLLWCSCFLYLVNLSVLSAFSGLGQWMLKSVRGKVQVSSSFGDAKYWDARYSLEGPDWESKDWLFDWVDVRELIEELLPDKQQSVLMLGCGNAALSDDMFEAGYRLIHNVDISPKVIATMAARSPEMRWYVADVLNMPEIATASMGACVDKSTLDAIRCIPLPSTGRRPVTSERAPAVKAAGNVDAVHKLINEGMRVLKPGGRYVCLSLADVDDLVSMVSSSHHVSSSQASASFFRVRSNSRDATYSLVVLDKAGGNAPPHPLLLKCVLPGRCYSVTSGRLGAFVLKKT